ncbi:MAG TPA: hypothetical protein VED40_05370 [Azospirillaceae bacterium]|nr:hypothetical protein [Azospirillaceae bacterium]
MSLDIFDTLLLRRVDTPADAFDIVGRRAVERNIIDEGVTPSLFRLVRQSAEQAARSKAQATRASTEVGLADIYAEASLGDPAALARIELEVERELVFANPLLLPWLEELARRGMRVVLLSDMYLSHAELTDLLLAAGIHGGLYAALYVSSGHGCSKRDGGLFHKLIADHPDILPDRILHMGDDPIADLAMPAGLGLRALHYVPVPRHAALQERERLVAGLARPAALPTRRLAALALREAGPDMSFWTEFGALVLGPAVAEYCRWVVEDCRRRGIGVIAPLMREAVLFAPLMEDWIRLRGYDMTVVPLHVSRQALAPLEFADFGADKARALLQSRPHLAWDSLMALAGIAIPAGYGSLTGYRMDDLAGAAMPDGRPALDAVLALFDAPENRQQAARRAAEVRRLAHAYLEDRLGSAGRVALVDLGARGTTPEAIAGLFQDGRSRFHTYLCYAVPDVAGPLRRGLPVSVYCADTALGMVLGRVLYRTPQILERALTGLHGTTLGYEDRDGTVLPLLGSPPARGDEAVALAAVQAGIRLYGTAAGGAPPALGEAALFPLAAALLMPTAEEAEALGSLGYDYNDGTDRERIICDAAAVKGVSGLAGPSPLPLMSMAMGTRPMTVPWPQGALTLGDPAVFSRVAEAVALEVGHGTVCRALVTEARRRGIRRIAIAAVGGDGGMGPEFIRTAAAAGLELTSYADLMEHLAPAPRFHGVPVTGLDRLAEIDADAVVLVTLGYADKLAELVRRGGGRSVRLVALGRPDLDGVSP